MSAGDRTVHARVVVTMRDGGDGHTHLIVRFDRAGRWYEECTNGMHARRSLSVSEAAERASHGVWYRRPGGKRFFAILRQILVAR